ncbi:peptide ABC transporter permease [Desulfosporosinus sp. HMP52]|nr:peptide ABC transporter permease [Desulfosporosinus sp. HMP52]
MLLEELANLKLSKGSQFGLYIVALMTLVAILAETIAPYDPLQVVLKDSLQGPNFKHFMGTDLLGRDILSRIIYGARASLIIGVTATSISLLIGLIVGSVSGYYGGWVDSLIMRLTDIFSAFPYFLMAIIIMTFFEPSMISVFFVLGIAGWTNYARLVRGQVILVKVSSYVEAARSIGAKDGRIIVHHVFPNILSPLIVYTTMNIPGVILAEAGLSFLGLGVQPPTPSWGVMLSEGKDFIFNAPWLIFWPGAALLFSVIGYNLLGNGMRDRLDPRYKQGGESNGSRLVNSCQRS